MQNVQSKRIDINMRTPYVKSASIFLGIFGKIPTFAVQISQDDEEFLFQTINLRLSMPAFHMSK